MANLKVGGELNASSLGTDLKTALLNYIYPVGSVYITIGSTSPNTLFGGTWTQIGAGYALWTATSGAGNTISAGLPNITGEFYTGGFSSGTITHSGALSGSSSGADGPRWNSSGDGNKITFNASSSNSIYGSSSTVQPPAYKVYAWRRTAQEENIMSSLHITNDLTVDGSLLGGGVGALLDAMYPKWSVYTMIATTTTPTTCPMKTLMAKYGITSTWTRVTVGYYPEAIASYGSASISYHGAGLPDIQGTLTNIGSNISDASATGAFSVSQGSNTYGNTNSGNYKTNITFKASSYNSIYGASSAVTPKHYYVVTWYRTA